MRFLIPVVMFAVCLAALEWYSTGRVTLLGARTLGVAGVSVLAARTVPWRRFALRVHPRNGAFRFILFGLFSAHFARTLVQESRRLLQARGLCITRKWGPGAFDSLRHAVAAVFRRALTRAERFYAAQLLKGLAG
jgi:energy-coupling factor transporter transmembrane protein EcfT